MRNVRSLLSAPTRFLAYLLIAIAAAVPAQPLFANGQSPYPNYNSSPIKEDLTGMDKNAAEIAAQIQIGWNVGNTLEATGGETAWENPKVTRELIQLAKKSGFQAIRLPVAWDQYADQETAEISQDWMDRIEEVVQYCFDADLYVLLNIHWDRGWLENNITPEKQEENNWKQRAYWEQIATRFRDYDQRLLFASANEPNVDDATQMEVLLSYHQTFIDTVRATGGRNAYRVLVVQGPRTDIELTDELMNELPSDSAPDRMMVEVHYYTPWNFAGLTEDESWGNQAFYWGEGYHSKTDTKYNSATGEEELEHLFDLMKTKFVEQGIPVLMGEFGAIRRDNLSGDDLQLHLASRTYFLDTVVEQANEKGLIPFYWDNGSLIDFGSAIFNRHTCTVAYPSDVDALTKIESLPYWVSQTKN